MQKRLERIYAILLALILAVGLSACSDDDDTTFPDTGRMDAGVDAEADDVDIPDIDQPDLIDFDTGVADTGEPDIGPDAAPDVGDDVGPADVGMDAGPEDTGVADTGQPDTGQPDTGQPDTGLPDIGPIDAGDTGDADDDADAADVGDADDAANADTGAPTPVTIESLSLTNNPNSTLSGFLDLETSRPTYVTITATSGGHSFELNYDGQPLADHQLTLIGFRADRTYQLDIRATTEDGAEVGDQVTFQSGPLPANFAPIEVTTQAPDRNQQGAYLFNLTRWTPVIDNSWGYLVMLDTDGEVVWYYRPPNRAQDVDVLPNGNLLFNTSQSNIIEINLAGQIVDQWSAEQVGVDYFHHEVEQLPNGNLVTMAPELRTINGYGDSGDITYDVVGDIIVEFAPDGQLVHQHSLFDILDPLRWGVGGFFGGYWNSRFDDEAPNGTRDWTHGNAVKYDPRDDTFIVSLRHQDWIIKIDRQTGALIWRMGAEGDFELLSGEWFYHQHDPMILENGNILLFDNGNLRPGLSSGEFYSRAVEFQFDATNADPAAGTRGTAQQVWEFTEGESFYSSFVSGVDKLPNGNVLVSDGARTLDQTLPVDDPNNILFTRIVEATDDPNPQKVFEVLIRDDSMQYGYTMYRAEWVDLF